MDELEAVLAIVLVVFALTALCVGVTVDGQRYSCTDCNCSDGVVFEQSSDAGPE